VRRLWWGIGILLCGCEKAVLPDAKADNAATRYAAGLVTSTEKAKMNADKANQAIAASQAAVDKLAEEAR